MQQKTTRLVGLGLLLVPLCGTAAIIDNSDGRFSARGDWQSSSFVTGHQGKDYLYAKKGGGQAVAVWRYDVPASGTYQIHAQWTAARREWRASDAPYRIYNNGKLLGTVKKDQSRDGGRFNLLGDYPLEKGALEIRLSNNADSYVVADAVKVDLIGDSGSDDTRNTMSKPVDRPPSGGTAVSPFDYHCYRLTYFDDFNVSQLDTSLVLGAAKYRTRYYWGDTNINHELQFYADPDRDGLDVLPVRDGKLKITARKLQKPIKDSAGKSYRYASGLITTQGSFSQTYGLFEIRAKLPRGKGLWPAFWLLPKDAAKWHRKGYHRMPELDVMEQLGQDMHVWYATVHTMTPPNGRGQGSGAWRMYPTAIRTTEDLSQDFHVYGMDWQADEIVWYFDGKEVKREQTPADSRNDPRYIVLNMGVGGSWPGSPDASTHFPAEYVIDYVKVYAKNGRCGARRH